MAVAVGATALVSVGAYLYLSRDRDDGVIHEISPPLSTHHQMQVERKPDGRLVYHDKIKEEVDRINEELDRRASQASSPSKRAARRCAGVIVCGAPGSGKGTQCAFAVAELGFAHLSSGDMLRAAAASKSELGTTAAAYMNAGKLVPDELVTRVVSEALLEPDVLSKGWLLDGFPRSLVQAQALSEAGCVPDKLLLVDVPDAVLLERITGRRIDPVTGTIYHLTFNPPPPEVRSRLVQRSDDSAEKLESRLKAYHSHVDALLSFYRAERGVKVVTIDGNRAPDAVWADVKRELLDADA